MNRVINQEGEAHGKMWQRVKSLSTEIYFRERKVPQRQTDKFAPSVCHLLEHLMTSLSQDELIEKFVLLKGKCLTFFALFL